MAINYAVKYSDKVAERFKLASVTNSAVNQDFSFLGARTVRVYSIGTVPLNNYTSEGANRYGTPVELPDMQQVQNSLAGQPPGGAGMLSVYRPIVPEHAGTGSDPIPYVYGMDCRSGLYYVHGGVVYLCRGDMIPCIWPPDTGGMWQWEAL